jgi:hypothetical protein
MLIFTLMNAMLQALSEKQERGLQNSLDFTEKSILSHQRSENRWEVHRVVL